MKTKAFIDTTVLTDALLKTGDRGKEANDAIRRYTISELPVYAIKEFKAGPLNNTVWMHNKLALTKSFSKALKALHGMALSPRRYTTATAIESLQQAAERENARNPKDFIKGYGHWGTMDEVLADKYRLSIRKIVELAWRKRRNITTSVVLPLSCYKELAPYEENGIIKLIPADCSENECCLGGDLRKNSNELKKLKDLLEKLNKQPPKAERQRQYQVIREILRKPKEPVSRKMCRSLGDIIFAIFCPKDAIVLTTNINDHELLANCLGKSVESPQ